MRHELELWAMSYEPVKATGYEPWVRARMHEPRVRIMAYEVGLQIRALCNHKLGYLQLYIKNPSVFQVHVLKIILFVLKLFKLGSSRIFESDQKWDHSLVNHTKKWSVLEWKFSITFFQWCVIHFTTVKYHFNLGVLICLHRHSFNIRKYLVIFHLRIAEIIKLAIIWA